MWQTKKEWVLSLSVDAWRTPPIESYFKGRENTYFKNKLNCGHFGRLQAHTKPLYLHLHQPFCFLLLQKDFIIQKTPLRVFKSANCKRQNRIIRSCFHFFFFFVKYLVTILILFLNMKNIFYLKSSKSYIKLKKNIAKYEICLLVNNWSKNSQL